MLSEQLMILQQELLEKANNKEAYDEIAGQIFKLREQRENALLTLLPETHGLQESMTCKITSKNSQPCETIPFFKKSVNIL